MYVVKNNVRHPATVFENIVFTLGLVLFGICTGFAFFSNAYVAAAEFTAFSLGCALMLYHNNAARAFVYDEEVVIRKFLKKYTYQIKHIESVTYTVSQRKYELIFSGKKFSIPDYYMEVKTFIGILKMAHNYFATEEGIEELKYYIKEKASAQTFLLLPKKDNPSIFSSKIGGIPYWDFSLEYPVDAAGKKMHLLCQLNFSECTRENSIFPQEGILQFFISSDDDLYGMSFAEPAAQKNWRIVFHETIDEHVRLEAIKTIIPDISEITSTPILNAAALTWNQSVSYMKPEDYRMNTVIAEAVRDITGEHTEKDIYEVLGSEWGNVHAYTLYRMMSETENYVLGYPSFTQYDIRQYMPAETAAYYDTNLLQLNSSSCGGQVLCWGDVGSATFLINSDALKRKDFSNVLYTWDCS